MRVVQASFFADLGRRSPNELLAAWPSLTDVAAAAAGEGCRVTVVQPAAHDATVERGGARFRFVRVAGRGTRWAWGLAGVLGAIREAEPDIVHLQGFVAPLHARLLARSMAEGLLLVQDHACIPAEGWRSYLHRWAFAPVDAVAFTAREQAQAFFASGVLPSEVRVFEVVEGSTRFTPGSREAAREATGLFGDPCLLWVGRLDENKDPLTALSALERAIPELPDPHLWLAYSAAPLLDSIRRRVRVNPDLEKRVHLLGEAPHHNMEDLYRAADFFVSASHREGSGYALIEAMACGTAPVVTGIPSFRKIAGPVGQLFPPRDVDSMANRLVELSNEDRPELRAQARRQFERELSYPAIGRQLRAAYGALLGRP